MSINPPVLFSALTVPFNRLAIGAIVENEARRMARLALRRERDAQRASNDDSPRHLYP